MHVEVLVAAEHQHVAAELAAQGFDRLGLARAGRACVIKSRITRQHRASLRGILENLV